jgi:hypothetical protein
MVAPEEFWGFELPQNLQKFRSLNRRQDREFRGRVAEAIHAEFIPCVDRPLVADEVLRLCERQALPTSGQAYSLAPLNSYLGHDERALYWCSKHAELLGDKMRQGLPWHDLEYSQQAFLNQLESWIKSGDAKLQLERVLQAERRKWGLA